MEWQVQAVFGERDIGQQLLHARSDVRASQTRQTNFLAHVLDHLPCA
jgi:hypothetical protein